MTSCDGWHDNQINKKAPFHQYVLLNGARLLVSMDQSCTLVCCGGAQQQSNEYMVRKKCNVTCAMLFIRFRNDRNFISLRDLMIHSEISNGKYLGGFGPWVGVVLWAQQVYNFLQPDATIYRHYLAIESIKSQISTDVIDHVCPEITFSQK